MANASTNEQTLKTLDSIWILLKGQPGLAGTPGLDSTFSGLRYAIINNDVAAGKAASTQALSVMTTLNTLIQAQSSFNNLP